MQADVVSGEAVSHEPQECRHNYGAWSTVERTNEAGDRMFVFQRSCYSCGHIDEERGAIIEDAECTPRLYAKVQGVGEEADD